MNWNETKLITTSCILFALQFFLLVSVIIIGKYSHNKQIPKIFMKTKYALQLSFQNEYESAVNALYVNFYDVFIFV